MDWVSYLESVLKIIIEISYKFKNSIQNVFFFFRSPFILNLIFRLCEASTARNHILNGRRFRLDRSLLFLNLKKKGAEIRLSIENELPCQKVAISLPQLPGHVHFRPETF